MSNAQRRLSASIVVGLVLVAARTNAQGEDFSVAIVSAAPDRIDVFVHDAHGDLATKRWIEGEAWTPMSLGYDALSGPIEGTPSAVAVAPSQIEVFARKSDGKLYGKSWSGEGWSHWNTLGSPACDVTIDGRAAVVSRAPDQLDLVVAGSDRMLYGASRNGTTWSPGPGAFDALGGPITADPTLVSWGPDRLDLFVTRDDGQLYTKSWRGAGWLPSQLDFEPLGAPAGARVSAKPTVVSWAPDRLDVFVAATDGRLHIKSWTGASWVPSQLDYNDLGAPDAGLLGAPTVVSWAPNRLDIFVRGKDGALYIKSWLGDSWYPSQLGWNWLSAPTNAGLRVEPSIVSRGVGLLDIFAIGSDDQLYQKSWTGSAWIPSQTEWTALGEPLAHSTIDMLPFWSGDTMHDESVLMVAANGGMPEATLMCPPSEILLVRDALLGTRYTPGVDWTYNLVTDRIQLSASSFAPFLDASELLSGGVPLFQEGHFFHASQLAVTYRHASACWSGPTSAPSSKLQTTRQKLNATGHITLAILGDSISAGYGASGFATAAFGAIAPYMQPWPDLVAQQWRSRLSADVQVINPSFAGQTASGTRALVHDAVSTQHPDLVVIALGMNDGTDGVTTADYETDIRAIIDDIRAASPSCDFILVAPMLANPDWADAGDQRQYLDVLTRVASAPGIALVDMTTTHEKLLERKRYHDMTGNGLNHPNDFLSRWYAQLVAGLL